GLATSGDGDFAAAADLALSLFGADRLMLGSDWPIAPKPLDLSSGFAPVLAHVRTWEEDAVRAVSRETAARVYRRLGEGPAAREARRGGGALCPPTPARPFARVCALSRSRAPALARPSLPRVFAGASVFADPQLRESFAYPRWASSCRCVCQRTHRHASAPPLTCPARDR